MRTLSCLLLYFFYVTANAQTNYATVSGKITTENDIPLGYASIRILGTMRGMGASDSGIFSFKVSSQESVVLQFYSAGYIVQQKKLILCDNATQSILIRLKLDSALAKIVTRTNHKRRKK